jgi:hypothetical protein
VRDSWFTHIGQQVSFTSSRRVARKRDGAAGHTALQRLASSRQINCRLTGFGAQRSSRQITPRTRNFSPSEKVRLHFRNVAIDQRASNHASETDGNARSTGKRKPRREPFQ